jgi:hypothetical protein
VLSRGASSQAFQPHQAGVAEQVRGPTWVDVAQIDGAHAGDLVDVLIDNNGFLVLAKSSQTRCSPEIAYGLWLPIVPGATLPVAQSPYPTNRPVRNLGATGRNAGFEGLAHAWIDSARSFDCDSA